MHQHDELRPTRYDAGTITVFFTIFQTDAGAMFIVLWPPPVRSWRDRNHRTGDLVRAVRSMLARCDASTVRCWSDEFGKSVYAHICNFFLQNSKQDMPMAVQVHGTLFSLITK